MNLPGARSSISDSAQQPKCKMHFTPSRQSTHPLINRLRHERGQALVEFAIVLPVLMLIIIGILTFGRYVDYSNQQTQLASEAARSAAVAFDPAGTQTIQDYTRTQATGELLNGSNDVTSKVQVYLYYPTGSSYVVGQSVRACVVSTENLLPLLGAGPSIHIVESATMRIEQAPPTPTWSTAGNVGAVPTQCPTA
jgi:uncharacterized protein (UPF0333 family)